MTELSCVSCGICINDVTYNACCYADDVLLCSLTVTGLQALIDIANSYVTNHGLSFNPAKSQCVTFGKNMFSTKMWHLNGVNLRGLPFHNQGGGPGFYPGVQFFFSVRMKVQFFFLSEWKYNFFFITNPSIVLLYDRTRMILWFCERRVRICVCLWLLV